MPLRPIGWYALYVHMHSLVTHSVGPDITKYLDIL